MGIFSSFSHTSQQRIAEGLSKRQNRSTQGRSQVSGETDTLEGGFAHALMAALFALPVAAVLGFLFLLIMTAVAYTHQDPDSLTTLLAFCALGLTSLLGGLIAARRGRVQPILCGCLLGVLLALLLVCVSLFFGDEARACLSLGFPTFALWGLHGGVVILSILGAKIGSIKRKNHASAVRRHMRR